MKKMRTLMKVMNSGTRAWEFKFSDRLYSATAFFTKFSHKCSIQRRCQT